MKNTKFTVVLAVFMGLLVLEVYGYRLYFPRDPYFDEWHYVHFIRRLFAGYFSLFDTGHPPLWFLATALVMKVFGDSSVTWRVVSLVCGVLVLPVLYFLAKRITRSSQASWLAVFIMALDGLSMTQARAAMMNSMMLLLMLLSLLYFLEALEGKKAWGWVAVFFGLAVSTKVVAVSLLFFFFPLYFVNALKNKQNLVASAGRFALFFVLLPVVIFFSSHAFIPFLKGQSFIDIWKIPVNYLLFHFETKQTYVYMSDWWTWPLMTRPVWFYHINGLYYYCIFCIGNPAVFWAIGAAMAYMLWLFFYKKSRAAGMVLFGFLTQWLCFIFVVRYKVFHYFYIAMPFVAMAIGLMLDDLWQKGRGAKTVAMLYLVLVAGMFVYWYPLWTGFPVTQQVYLNHMWFEGWFPKS